MRTKDRLAELKSIAEDSVYNDTVELYIKEPNEGKSDQINDIFEEVDKIRGWVEEIAANTRLIRALHSDRTYHINRNLQDQLDSTVTKTNATGLKVCGALRQFEALVTSSTGEVRTRIARLQYATMRRLYVDALEQHHALLQTIKTSQYQLIHQHIEITNLTLSDEEQQLLETDNIQLFVDNIVTRTRDARLALREVESRHAALMRVETSIREVHELFMQMAHMIAEQQEKIDTVAYYALQTTEHVQTGGQELLKGTVNRTKARKKKLSLIICLVSGFLIVLIILIMT